MRQYHLNWSELGRWTQNRDWNSLCIAYYVILPRLRGIELMMMKQDYNAYGRSYFNPLIDFFQCYPSARLLLLENIGMRLYSLQKS